MAKPTLNYYHVLNVAKVKTDVAYFTTIQAAIASIAAGGYTPTAANPFAIYVHPGTYSEQVTMANFVDVIAQGGREETIIDLLAPEADEPTVIGANAMIKGFTIVSDGGSFQPRCVENSAAGEGGADGFEIDDCVLQIDNVGAHTPIVLLATNSMEIRNSLIDTAGVALTAVSLDTSTENYTIYNCLIGGETYSILVTDANTLYLNGCTLTNELEHTDCTVETIIRDCVLEEVDFNGGLLCEIHHSYVETIAVDGGIVDAFGGTIRACTSSTGTRFTWRLDDANFRVLAYMVIQDAIGQATAGDTIHLDAVRYTETITLADGVHIEGTTADTDTPTEIYWTDDATAVVTADGVESSVRRVKIWQANAGATAYCLTVAGASVLAFSHCMFDCDGVNDAIHMENGTLTLDECNILDGDINLSVAKCILTLDHCNLAGPAGNVTLETAATEFDHEITCLHTDFDGNNVDNAATGDTILVFKYCSDINNFTDDGTNVVAGDETVIENTMIGGTALKSGTTPWLVRLARIAIIQNTNATSAITIWGGYLDQCTDSTGAIVWWHDSGNELMVIAGMKVEHAVTAASAGDTIRLGQGSWTLAAVMDIEKSLNFIGEGPEESQMTISSTSPVFNVGADVGNIDVTCTFQGLKIENSGTGEAIQLVSGTGAGDTVVVVRECILDGADCVRLDNVGNQTETFEAFETEFNATGVCIDVDHTFVSDIDIHNCEFSAGEVVDLAGAAHTFDAWDCECGDGNVTGDANNPVVNLTRCNDVDVITNAGAGNWVIEHCTTGNIATSGTGDITIRNSNVGILTQTNAGGDMFIYNSYVIEANPTLGDMTFYECYIATVDSDGGTIVVHGGSIAIVDAPVGTVVWWLNSRELMVIENMVIQDAIDAATAAGPPTATDPYVVRVGPGTYTEQIAMDDYCDVIAVSGRADTIIYHECTADSQATVTGENALIKGFTIQSYGGVASTWMTRCVNAGTAGFDIEDCILEPSNAAAGAITLNATASCNIWDCLVDNAGAAATGALFTTGAQTYIVRGTTFNAATDAIQVTTAITALNLTECTVLDNFNQDGGTVNVYRCRLEALALGTASCTFRAEFTQYTGAITTTAEDLAHDITLIQCDLQGGGVDSSAVGASSTTTLDMRGCSNVGKLTNDGIGNWEVRDSDVQDCETTNTGFITIFGGDVATCTVAAAGGDIVWWKDTNLIYVVPNMHIEHALTDASLAAGDTIMLGQGTWTESNLIMINGVDIIGQGSGLSIIDASDNTNPVIVVGNNVSCEIHDITIDNDDVGGAITISPVANASALTLEGCNVISSAAVDCVVVTMGGAGTGTLTARRTDFTSDAANSIILMASTDGGLGYLNATDCTFNTAAIAIELTSSNVVDVNVTRATFDTCTLAVYSTGDIHTIDIDFSEFNGSGVLAAGVELAGNAPVCNFTNCNDIGTFTHSVACTVTLHDCWISGAYTIAAVAGIVNAFNTQFAAFINNGDGAGITFQECLGADFSNNLTSTVTIEGGNWDTVLQAGTAGTIDIYEATIATELDCGNTGAINAYNCHVATIDANAGSVVTLYGGTLLDVADNTGQIIWWEAPHRLRVIAAATANMKIMDAADAAAAGDLIVIGPGTFAEALALDTAVNACTYQGAGREDTIIQLAAADVVTITVDGVVLEDLTIEITGGAGHDCVTTANATVIRHCNIIATSAAVTECHGIATTGTGGVTVDGCDITSSGHASSDGIYLTGTGATVVMESIINATLADINQQADITGDLQTYNNELAGGGFKIGNNAAYNCYAHGDVFTAVTHDGLGHMFLQNEPNIALVREGMKIADGIALATADTPSVANPWTVLVGPGVYTEQITMDDYVSVIAESGYEVTKITWEVAAAHDEPTITMESNCRLEGFTIESDGNGDLYRARCVDSTAMSDWLIKDCLFVQVDSAVAANQAVFLETSGTGMRLEHCRWSQATTDDIKRGLQVDAAGIEVLLQDCETYGEDYDFYLNEGKVETRKCMIRGGGWYITDDADSIGVSWDDDWNDGVAPVTFAGTNGEFADLSGAREYTCAADLLIGEACYISGANAVDEATNASGAPLPAEGIVVWKSAADALTCYVKKHGYIYWANPAPAWVAGTTMFLGVNGAMVNARPANAIAQIIGVCKGTKEMLINITLTDAGTAVISTHLVLPELGVGAAQGVHDRWPVIIMDSGAQTCHFALKVPDDFLSLSKVYIVGIPTTGGTISCTVNTSAGDCEGAEATIQDTMSIVTEAIVDDRLENLDVTTAFDVLGLAQARMVGVQFVLDALVTTTQFNVVGLYMEYVKA